MSESASVVFVSILVIVEATSSIDAESSSITAEILLESSLAVPTLLITLPTMLLSESVLSLICFIISWSVSINTLTPLPNCPISSLPTVVTRFVRSPALFLIPSTISLSSFFILSIGLAISAVVAITASTTATIIIAMVVLFEALYILACSSLACSIPLLLACVICAIETSSWLLILVISLLTIAVAWSSLLELLCSSTWLKYVIYWLYRLIKLL